MSKVPFRAHRMKKPMFGTVWGKGRNMNGNCVGLDPEKQNSG